MNRFFITLFLALAALTANAQDILNELRRDQSGQGKIVVNQSREIEQLVNAKPQSVKTDTKKEVATTKTDAKTDKTDSKKDKVDAKTAKSDAKTTTKDKKAAQTDAKNVKKDKEVAAKTDAKSSTQTTTKTTSQDKTTVKPAEKKEAEHVVAVKHDIDTLAKDSVVQAPKKRVIRKSKDTEEADGTNDSSVNLNRKVMRHAYKTTGYRVQVYNGGNTRADRQKCQEIAARIKASYPNMPIYVHFYSPSWKCRAGNFTSRSEADKFLRKIKAMGYKTAVLVKGTISVQY